MSKPLFDTEHFWVEAPAGVPIPGYLILRTRQSVTGLHELPGPALSALGPLSAAVSRSIEQVVSPERIYLLRFSEEDPHVHFHFFPRFPAMAALYVQSFPESLGKPVNGPRLFDWARRPDVLSRLQFPMTASEAAQAIAERVRTALASAE